MRVHEARIIYVDPTRLCCDTISINGLYYTEDVNYTNTGLKESGDLNHPELGDIAVVATDEDGGSNILRWYSARTTGNYNLTQFISGFGGILPLNKQLPGDRVISGPDGAFLSLLRGKLSMMGSSPLCQTIYSGLEGLIRTVCQNYDAIGSGFRVFSINSGDEVITRLCFSGSDRNFIEGANNNEDAISENFEYQIDFTKDGMSVFIGDIDETTKKRNNNLVININPNGDITVTSGKNLLFEIFSNGIIETTITDSNSNVIYNKMVGTDGIQLLFKEIIKGDVIRQIDGNLYEEITGTIEREASTVRQKANIIDNDSAINRKISSVNLTELNSNPQAGLIIR